MLAKTPWTPVPKAPQRKLSKDERRRFVFVIVPVLQKSEPTAFRMEGYFRHSMRGYLCLQGFPWHLAEGESAMIIARALQRVGARRPRWTEGQHEYTATPGFAPAARWTCAHCGGSVPSGRRLYCSRACSNAAAHERQRTEYAQMSAVERELAKEVRKLARADFHEANRTFTCAECGQISTWKPAANPRTFCSRTCAKRAMWKKRREAGAWQCEAVE
jgi:endogenous inhibitor of DNA gyrase (YacG/DUF329 family)